MLARSLNPRTVLRLLRRVDPWLGIASVALFAFGLVDALLLSPPDYQQGESVRIMYVHVPAAYLASQAYLLLAAMSALYLVWRNPLADMAAAAAAPVGAAFTALALVTGSLWGRPTWGTWWVWDARLTSVLVLFFLYLGYIALRQAVEAPDKARRLAAWLAVIGAIDLPIIRFSVEWWNTLHQPASLFRPGGPTIDPSMLRPLLVMMAAYQAFFLLVWARALRARLAPRLRHEARMERAEA